MGSHGEHYDFVKRNAILASNNKYQSTIGKSFSLFLDQLETSNFIINELYVHSNKDSPFENLVTNECEGEVLMKKFLTIR